MDSHEVVIGEPQGKSGVVVLPLLRESVGQAGEAPNLHSHREVLSFDVRGANLARIGASRDWDHLRSDNL